MVRLKNRGDYKERGTRRMEGTSRMKVPGGKME
jgi:hypothetical protein